MSNEPEITPGADAPEVTATETIIHSDPEKELEEKRYEWQPTDEQGRPIGGRQVIKYRTVEEFQQKFAEQNTLLIRKLREETRKNRLGITEQETIGDDAPRLVETVSFAPKTLSEEDRVRLSRDLLDPERFDQASDELFTAKLGVSPSELTKTISEIQRERFEQRAISEATAFAQANPDYVMCQENSEAIVNWMLRYNLAPVRANYQRAFDTLKSIEPPVLVLAPVQQSPEPTPPPVETPVVVETPQPVQPVVEETPAPEPKPKPVSRVPVALTRSDADETGAVPTASGSDIVYEVVVGNVKRRFTGLAAVDAMPADEYRRRVMADPNFVKKVEKLEQDRAARRKQR